MKIDSSVTQTASDALLAKWSAISAGYLPVRRNGQIYRELLRSVSERSKRQTPLVNAGYASRIATMTSLVEDYVSFHSDCDPKNSDKPIQVLMLGCGLDVLGLWSHSLNKHLVRVYEVDCPEICEAKCDTLVSAGILRISKEATGKQNTSKAQVVVQGFLELNSSAKNDTYIDATTEVEESNYTLLSADLRDTDSLQNVLSVINRSLPTLVVSELVLAYLGQRGADSLLEYCATCLCAVPNSALVAYEPLGAGEGSSKSIAEYSVTEGYKRAYCTQFESKLQRGTAKRADEAERAETEVYHPLGISCAHIETRMRRCGFPSSYVGLAGTTTASSITLRSPELFDEHAALALHLRTYAVVCAFSQGTAMMLKRQMCPWSRRVVVASVVENKLDGGICILPIEPRHQEQVRSLFQQTYQGLFEEYPAVRKMVKTALKTDLSGKKDVSVEDTGVDASAIGSRYMSWGGLFVVAIESDNRNRSHRVVGCIGLRPSGHANVCKSKYAYEIHRLSVDINSRGKGIGKALVGAVESFVTWALPRGSPYCLVATTPAMLTAANELYQSVGFKLKNRNVMGKIDMNTYVKERDMKA